MENFSVSFSDGRALCYIVHHYHPAFLTRGEILDDTTQNQPKAKNAAASNLDDSFGSPVAVSFDKVYYNRGLNNEKENFKLLFHKVS